MADYDVIVVGGGSAGAVVAARLSEDAGRRVLLLEAGPDHRSAGTPAGISGPSFWAACAEPGRIYDDLLALHHAGQEFEPYLRGRGIGGSSAVNAMVGLRGVPADYDRWADELGCAGWAWEEFRPWLLGVEDDADFGGDDAHGKGGPIPLHRLPIEAWPATDRAMAIATADLGHDWCPDYHAPDAVGFGPIALTIRDGRRVSTNDAYLEPARDRSNLTVRGDTLVDRVTFHGRRTTGVRTAAGEEITAPLVVVCAGAIHSPAILLRSGVDDRPVGENLIDHPLLPVTLVLTAEQQALLTGARTCNAMLRFSSGMDEAGPADLQILPITPFGLEEPQSECAVLGLAATRVFSRGRITLAGASPLVQPRIELEMLTDVRDRDRMRVGFAHLVDLARHPEVSALADGLLAGLTALDDLADPAELEAWMDATVTNYVHVVGSCRMGAPDDPAAVVDFDCALIGYPGTYVVDASVMPDIPRANTHLTTVAIAERIADTLRHR